LEWSEEEPRGHYGCRAWRTLGRLLLYIVGAAHAEAGGAAGSNALGR